MTMDHFDGALPSEPSKLCRGCGACCAPGIAGNSAGAKYLEVLDSDYTRGFTHRTVPVAVEAASVRRHGAASRFLPVVRGQNDYTQCEHLEGTVLSGARCGCYETRPQACRIFQPGSAACQELRQAWLIHNDKVDWVMYSRTSLNRGEAVDSVVSRVSDDCLGVNPDYARLRRRADEEKSPCREESKRPLGPTSRNEKQLRFDAKKELEDGYSELILEPGQIEDLSMGTAVGIAVCKSRPLADEVKQPKKG